MKNYPVQVKKILNLGTPKERLSKRSLLRYVTLNDRTDPTSIIGKRIFFKNDYCEIIAIDADFYTRDYWSNEPVIYVTEKKVHPILGEEKLLEIAAKEDEGAVKDSFFRYSENCGYEELYCTTHNGFLKINCYDCSDFHIKVFERYSTGNYHLIRNENFIPKMKKLSKMPPNEKE